MSWLASVDAEGVTEKQRLDGVAALEALKGAAAAAQARLSAAAVVDREALGEDSRSVRADVALARRCSPTLADQHVGVAKALVGEMPETMGALTRGEISERRAMLMVRETACLSVEHRGVVDQELASKLATMGDKALAGAARRAGAKLDAESCGCTHQSCRRESPDECQGRGGWDGVGVAPMYPCAAVPSALAR